MSYVLGIDLGTSSLKGTLMNEHGEVIHTASQEYPLLHPASGYSEQDPAVWVEAFEFVLEQLKNEVTTFQTELKGISFSGQMHSLVMLDEEKKVLRNAILWNDVRTSAQCQYIMEVFGDELLAITKNRALEGFTLPKILWVQENEPEIWEKVRYLMLPKDYLEFYLTGNLYTDYSDAAGTLLLDIEEKKWSEKILNKFSISREILPTLIESTGIVGCLKDEFMSAFGFLNEVQIIAGGADNACAAVGSGILSNEVGMVSIGTSGVFLSYEQSSQIDYEGKLHLFNHAQKNSYYSMGVTLAAGHSLNWFKETFAANQSFEDLLNGIEHIPPGANGLIFTPYISGERTPYFDSQIRGSFIGLDDRHTLNHFTRAVIEGITFSLKDSQKLMELETGRTFKKVVSVGGGSKSKAWLQIQADVFDAEIIQLASEQGPGVGAAMIGAVGLNWYESLKECADKFVVYKDTILPKEKNVEQYKKIYHEYHEVYKQTKSINHSLRKYEEQN